MRPLTFAGGTASASTPCTAERSPDVDAQDPADTPMADATITFFVRLAVRVHDIQGADRSTYEAKAVDAVPGR